jgi:hypothetical protein
VVLKGRQSTSSLEIFEMEGLGLALIDANNGRPRLVVFYLATESERAVGGLWMRMTY